MLRIVNFNTLADNADAVNFTWTWSGIGQLFLGYVLPVVLIIIAAFLLYFLGHKLIIFLTKKNVNRRMSGQTETEIKKRVNTLTIFSTNIFIIIVVIIAVVAVLAGVFNINVAAIIAGLGVAGLGISLALQSLFKDLINGFFIMIDEYYQIGDTVTIAGLYGIVEDISLRRTILRDNSGVVHIVPNSNVVTTSNFTRGFSCINLNISVAYEENLSDVITVLNEVCLNLSNDSVWKKELLNTPRVLRVDDLGDSGVAIKIIGDTRPGSHDAVMGELRLRIKNEFDKRGIDMPYPTQTVRIINN